TRADALGDRLDRAALACGVAALEDDADLRPRPLDPLLQSDELAVQPAQLSQVRLVLHPRRRPVRGRCRGDARTVLVLVVPLLLGHPVLPHVLWPDVSRLRP